VLCPPNCTEQVQEPDCVPNLAQGRNPGPPQWLAWETPPVSDAAGYGCPNGGYIPDPPIETNDLQKTIGHIEGWKPVHAGPHGKRVIVTAVVYPSVFVRS